MSDLSLRPRSAFASAFVPTPGHTAVGIEVAARDDLVLATVIARRGQRTALAARIDALFGMTIPTGPKRVAAANLSFIGTGPDQWVAVAEGVGDPQAFVADLAAKLAGTASVSDQSDARAVIRISGPRARDVLAKGLPIDLHPSVFGPGDSALSSIALIGAHLWQIDEAPTYEIAVFRSLAGSFADWLMASAAEFGIAAMS